MSNRKKVLHVVSSMNAELGGVSHAIRMIVDNLSAKGIYNEVVSLDSTNISDVKNDTFRLHKLGPAKSSWQYSSKLFPWLIENLLRFDIVIVHGLWLFHGYAVRKSIRQIKKKLLLKQQKEKIPKFFVFPHGMLDPYFQKTKGRKIKALRNLLYWKFIENKIINEADQILFTTEQECKLASRSFSPYHPKQVNVIGLGIENPPVYEKSMRETFLTKCPQIGNNSYLLFLSRLNEKKGADILIKIYTDLLSNTGFGDILPKLVVAGPGLETDYGKKLQKLARNFQDSIFFPGMLTGNAKWGAFYGCEAFVLPTHQENFGIAIVEALACKKPVLISNKTNIWEEIKKGGGGLVEEDTISGINKLLEDWFRISLNEKKIYAHRAFETYQLNYSMEIMLKKWVSLVN